jgi:cytochrome c oxidase subunit 2
MLNFLYLSGWGAFTIMLFFQIPFLIFFFYIVYRKAQADPKSGGTDQHRISRVERLWVTIVVVLFVGINVASMKFMPTISTAHAASTKQNIQDVEVTAQSWSYEISNRELEVGRPVRFSAKSADTVHGFAIYHPDGRVLFTMMLIPGVSPSSIIHTFTEPGNYKVRCLEYCGVAHHVMRDQFVVTAKNE